MIEIDGPPRAYFTSPDGPCVYTQYAFGARTAKECIDGYINWRNSIKGMGIVWRRRPELSHEVAETAITVTFDENGKASYADSSELLEEPYWKISWRCYVIPSVDLENQVPVKEEGAPVPMKVY